MQIQKRLAYVATAMLVLVVGLLPASAQEDQLTQAFNAVRQALSLRFNVDLTYVANYTWEQVEFANGIDDCTTNVEAPRNLYFGWRFVITAFDGRQFEGRSSFDSTVVTTCDSVTSGTTAPAPAGAADLPAPVAGSAAVGDFELGGHVLELNGTTIATAQSAGMTWVKLQSRHVQGADPSTVANLISAARTAGFRILLGIPIDVQAAGANFDAYIQNYAAYVGGVAALGPDAIEVGNEPNIDREWPANLISGENYTRLLAAAFNSIKSANSSVLVISGGPAPTGFFGAAGCGAGGCNDDVFMQQMAAAGAAQYMDCVGLHYNEGILPPSATSGDSRGSYPTYFFSTMLSRGYAPFGGKPVCFTELGYLSPQGFNEPLPGAFAWAANTTVAQQAEWLAAAAAASAQSGRVRMMIVWNVDFPFWGADPAGGYAIRRPDGSCPACSALASVMGSI
jgi:hypothetical protein